MNIKNLEEYVSLKNEIKILEERIEKLKSQEPTTVSDTVRGSSKFFPYTERTYTITGIDDSNDTKIGRSRIRLVERKKRLESKLEEIEEFIDTVDESDIRQIIQLKYIDGLPWKMVSRRVFGYPSENRARMRITRFFAEI